jgi:hypothetical protein
MRRVLLGTVISILVFGLAVQARAQSTTGTLVGDIVDATGARLPGVAVKVINQQTGVPRDTISNDKVTDHDHGRAHSNARTSTSHLERHRDDKVASINVSACSHKENMPTTPNIFRSFLEIANFMDLALLSPGVVMDQGAAQGGQVTPISFGALDQRYKSIWLEGVDFNDEVTSGGSSLSDPTRIQLAQEAIQEFQVMATGYSTEFGRSAGGVINIVSKSGGNDFHGNLFYFRRSDKFAKSPFRIDSNGQAVPIDPEPYFKIQQTGGTVGGPLKKDRAHFFFSYERQLSNRTVSIPIPDAVKAFVTSLGYDARTEVPVDTKVNNYDGKLTCFASSHTLNLSYSTVGARTSAVDG